MHSADLAALGRTHFYRDRLAAPEGRKLARLPLTRRGDLLRDELAHLPLGTRRPDGAAPPVGLRLAGAGTDPLVLA
jgi:hypothetical protein